MLKLLKTIAKAIRTARKKKSKRSSSSSNVIYTTTDKLSFPDYSFATSQSPRNPMGWRRGKMDVVEAATIALSGNRDVRISSNKVRNGKKTARNRKAKPSIFDGGLQIRHIHTDVERPPVLMESDSSDSDSKTSTTDSDLSDSCTSADYAPVAPVPTRAGPIPILLLDLNSDVEKRDLDKDIVSNVASNTIPLSKSGELRLMESRQEVSDMLESTIATLLDIRSSASVRLCETMNRQDMLEARQEVDNSYLSLNHTLS